MSNEKEKSTKLQKAFFEIGRLFIDFSKLAFASLVLGTVIRWDVSDKLVFIVGLLFTGINAFIGIILVILFKED